jgi:Secretion system C-terminal sorting domain
MKVKVKADPNPFTGELTITMLTNLTVNLVVRLMNSNGTVIRVKACPLLTGENNIKLNNLNRYATGEYILEVKLLNGDLLETISLVKA